MCKFRTIILFSMLTVICMPLQAETEVYGKLLLALQNIETTGAVDVWEIRSHSSRFGIKGSSDLDAEGLKAIYKVEWDVDVADNKEVTVDVDSTYNPADNSIDNDVDVGRHIKARDQYVGLKGGFGQFIIGRVNTPFKQAQGKLDLFNDFNGDIKVIMADGEIRADNMFQYSTPKIGDAVTISFLGQPGENAAGENGVADATSISVTYSSDSLHLALASDSDLAGANTSATRIVGVYKIGDFGVGALIQDSDYNSTDNEAVQIASFYYKVGKVKLKVQAGSASNYDGISNRDADLTAFGVDYMLAKKTSVGVHVISQEGGDKLAANVAKDTVGFNMVHSF